MYFFPRLFCRLSCAAVFCLLFAFGVAASGARAFAQNIAVTFRLADPDKRFVRAFVPGEFNNWGPNAGGRISAGAASEMQYDGSSGEWTKTLSLRVGTRYLYKFHVHRDASGGQFEWFPDALNEVQDGTPNQNSVLVVAPALVFQPSLQTNANGAATGVRASILSVGRLTRVALVAGADTTTLGDEALNLVRQSGVLRAQFPAPVATSATIRITASDDAGNATSYRFPTLINATPAWARDVVWYQIFPERFRNGDPRNDPTRASLELGNGVSERWRVKVWGSDWFSRDDWEREFGSNFYNNSIFHRRYGGDLQGIIDKLDYLKDLGVTALYLNPVFYANSLHKYDGNAHHHIDPYFGPNPEADLAQIARENALDEPYNPKNWGWTSADSLFLRLIQEVKRRDMRIIIDGVWNHTGRGFFAFQDLARNQAASRFKNWYVVNHFDDPATAANEFSYKSWENFTSLPEFARSPDGRDLAPGPKEYVWNVTRRWMDPNGDGNPDDGVDGWRLDVVPYMPLGFWNEWNAYVRTINPNAYTSAEIWTDQTPATVRGGNFSAAMNYWAFQQPVKDFFINRRGTAESFWNTITSRMNAYSPEVQAAMQNMMDSHDTERLASQIVNSNLTGTPTNNAWGRPSYLIRKPTEQERDIQKLIALFQMTFTGAPMLYYGTESGVWGGNDPDNRSPMNWSDIRFDAQAGSHSPAFVRPVDDMNFDSSLVGFYKRTIIQKMNPPEPQLSFGLISSSPLFAFNRTRLTCSYIITQNNINELSCSDRRFTAIVFNPTNDSVTSVITSPEYVGSSWFLLTYFTGTNPNSIRFQNTLTQDLKRSITVMMPPRSGAVFQGSASALTGVLDKAGKYETIKIFPQPFTERTTLEYTLERASEVLIRVHDALGREVMRLSEGALPAGMHTREIDGSGLASGVYFCTVTAGGQSAPMRVMMVKR
jgi:glycosidase